MRNLYFISIILIYLFSCSEDSRNISKIIEFKIDKDIVVIPVSINDSLYNASKISLFEDVIVYSNNKVSNEGLLSMLYVNNGGIRNIINKGRATNELLSIWSISRKMDNNNFCIYDIITSQLLKLNLSDIMDSDGYKSNKISLEGEAMNTFYLDMLNDSIFICTGIYDKCRIITINSEGKILSRIGTNPNIYSKKKIDPIVNEAYQGVVKVRPDGQKYIIGCKYADQIEIYDTEEKEQEIYIKGPIFKEPIYNESKGSMAIKTDESYDAYIDIAVNQEYILGLFSGTKFNQPQNCNAIHIFDWDGNPIARYTTEHSFKAITIDNKSNRVYLLTKDKSEIYYFDINC